LAITHRHRDSPFRFPIVDIQSQINGDALLLQLLSYDFVARHGNVVGHLNNQRQLDFVLEQVRNIFKKIRNSQQKTSNSNLLVFC
jgi:mRNA interferase MazF